MAKNFETKRGYCEVNYMLRATKVDKKMRGYQLLQTAAMSYLSNPNLTIEELVKIAKDNTAIHLETEKQCFEEMKDALYSICTNHMDKLEDDNVVYKFIDNITSEIRIEELIKIHMMESDIQVKQEIISTFIRVCLRRKMKPHDSFSAVLNHTAGKCGYEEMDQFVNDLYQVVSNEEVSKEKKKKAVKEFVDFCLAEKDSIDF